jgi:hypothetical protein
VAVLDGIRVVVTGSAAALDMSGVLLSDILTELGFDEAAIQTLINGGVLVGPAASGRPQ